MNTLHMNGMIFCGNRECDKTCLRKDNKIEYGIMYLRENYQPDKKGICKYFISIDDVEITNPTGRRRKVI